LFIAIWEKVCYYKLAAFQDEGRVLRYKKIIFMLTTVQYPMSSDRGLTKEGQSYLMFDVQCLAPIITHKIQDLLNGQINLI
jgi:hypothetical protein